MLPGFPCSVPRSSPAVNRAANIAAEKHVFKAWQLRARMHTDHQGPASQDEERDSFLANIGRIKLHQDSYPDSPMSLSSRVHGAISQAQEGLGETLLLLLRLCCSGAECISWTQAAALGMVHDRFHTRPLIVTQHFFHWLTCQRFTKVKAPGPGAGAFVESGCCAFNVKRNSFCRCWTLFEQSRMFLPIKTCKYQHRHEW